jgi:hypothetical protein
VLRAFLALAIAAALASVGVVAAWVSLVSWPQLRAPQESRVVASPPNPSAANEPTRALAPPSQAAPAASEPRRLEPDREAEDPDPEEIERRRAAAARIRKLIEAGPNATGPPVGGGVLAEGDPHPVYENGELLGVELQNLRPDGLYAHLGLRDGDLVRSINGVGLAESGALLQEIAGSQAIELSVEHEDGTQDLISVPIEQILEELKILD